jgi:hypothetical protein
MAGRSNLMVICAVALVLMWLGTASAQVNRGNWIVQGTASFQSLSGKAHGNQTTSIFVLSPRLYYFVADRWAVGGRLALLTASSGGASSTDFMVGPDANYFFKINAADLYPYAGAGLFIASHSDGSSQSGFTFALHAGAAYLIKPHLSVQPEMEFDFDNRGSNSGTTFLIGVGLAGFLY